MTMLHSLTRNLLSAVVEAKAEAPACCPGRSLFSLSPDYNGFVFTRDKAKQPEFSVSKQNAGWGSILGLVD